MEIHINKITLFRNSTSKTYLFVKSTSASCYCYTLYAVDTFSSFDNDTKTHFPLTVQNINFPEVKNNFHLKMVFSFSLQITTTSHSKHNIVINFCLFDSFVNECPISIFRFRGQKQKKIPSFFPKIPLIVGGSVISLPLRIFNLSNGFTLLIATVCTFNLCMFRSYSGIFIQLFFLLFSSFGSTNDMRSILFDWI